jgi:hypothetical protein
MFRPLGEEKGVLAMKKGQKYHIKVEFASAPACKLDQGTNVLFGGGAVRIGGAKIIDADEEVKHAAALAKDADHVIICAGLNVSLHLLQFTELPDVQPCSLIGKERATIEKTCLSQDTWTLSYPPSQPQTLQR